MFAAGFFPSKYFPRAYFPAVGAAVVTRARYFPHGFFARAYFPDQYFPGADGSAPPPPPPDLESGGAPARDRIPDIRARVRLFIPPFVVKVRGKATPADATVSVEARLHGAIQALIRGEAQPADVLALAIRLGLSPVDAVLLVTTASAPVRSARSADDDDDEELLDYWSMLKH